MVILWVLPTLWSMPICGLWLWNLPRVWSSPCSNRHRRVTLLPLWDMILLLHVYSIAFVNGWFIHRCMLGLHSNFGFPKRNTPWMKTARQIHATCAAASGLGRRTRGGARGRWWHRPWVAMGFCGFFMIFPVIQWSLVWYSKCLALVCWLELDMGKSTLQRSFCLQGIQDWPWRRHPGWRWTRVRNKKERCKGQPKDVQEISQRYHAWAPKQLRICPPDHWPSDFKGRDRSEGAVGRLLPGTMPKRPQRGLEQVPEEEEAGNSLTWGRLTFSHVEFINHLEFFLISSITFGGLSQTVLPMVDGFSGETYVFHSIPIPMFNTPKGPMVSRGCLILRVMGLPGSQHPRQIPWTERSGMAWMAIREVCWGPGEEWLRKCMKMLHDMSHHIWILADHISDQGMAGWDTTGIHWVHFLLISKLLGVQPRRFNAEFSAPCAQWTTWEAGVNLPGQAVSFKKSFIGRCSGWASSLYTQKSKGLQFECSIFVWVNLDKSRSIYNIL